MGTRENPCSHGDKVQTLHREASNGNWTWNLLSLSIIIPTGAITQTHLVFVAASEPLLLRLFSPLQKSSVSISCRSTIEHKYGRQRRRELLTPEWER